MKRQVLHRYTYILYEINRYRKYTITASAAGSWKKNPKNDYKTRYLKIYPPTKLQHLSVIVILNHINNLIDHAIDFCLLHYLLSSDSTAMTLHIVFHSLHHYLKLLTKRD